MSNIFFYSDPHFGHEKIITFKNKYGERIRPFLTIDDMNSTLVDNYNRTVGKNDTVYFLGDVAFNQKTLEEFIPQLNGHKKLILGNHDYINSDILAKYFGAKLYSWKSFTNENPSFVACHYPLHYDAFLYKANFCVHGHIHEKLVLKDNSIDLKYINVSVEQTQFAPFPLEVLLLVMKSRMVMMKG